MKQVPYLEPCFFIFFFFFFFLNTYHLKYVNEIKSEKTEIWILYILIFYYSKNDLLTSIYSNAKAQNILLIRALREVKSQGYLRSNLCFFINSNRDHDIISHLMNINET